MRRASIIAAIALFEKAARARAGVTGQVSAPAGYEGEWLRKDLQGCDPFDHPHGAGYNPPPCPAL
jgi:hypothetical protein